MYNKKFFWGSVILGVMILLGAWFFQVFTDLEIASRLMAAILGVVITAIITQLLLQGQTDKEEHLRKSQREWQEKQAQKSEEWRIAHDRSNVVFGEKLKIYQKFLDTLYNAVKDGELTESEKLELQYQTSLVAMHCEPDNIQKLSEAVKLVIGGVCGKETQNSPNKDILLKTLFEVVEALRKDLYDKDFIDFPQGVKEETVRNFNEAYNNAKEGHDKENDDKQHLSVDLNVLSEVKHVLKSGKMEFITKDESQTNNKVYNTTLWDVAVKEWQEQHWKVKSLESEDWPLEITRGDDYPGRIDMGFYRGHYYIQAKYANDSLFAKCLKQENGGYKQQDMWYEYPKLSYDFSKGEFIDGFKSSVELQKDIIGKVKYLLSVIENNYRTTQWMQEVDSLTGWNLYVWRWSTLACESQSEDKGKIYLDTMPDPAGGDFAVIRIGNRALNVPQLEQTLKDIGAPSTDISDKKDCWATLDKTTSLEPKDVGDRIKYWIGKLSENNKSNNLKS